MYLYSHGRIKHHGRINRRQHHVAIYLGCHHIQVRAHRHLITYSQVTQEGGNSARGPLSPATCIVKIVYVKYQSCYNDDKYILEAEAEAEAEGKGTRSFATAKSTARPSCLVGVLYDIYRETNNISTANHETGHETYRIPRNNAK